MNGKPSYEELEKRIRKFERAEREQKTIDKTLQESSEIFSFFIKNSPIYAFIKEVSDEESKVLHVSDNYIDMVGIPASQIRGKNMFEIFPDKFAEKITQDDIGVVNNEDNLVLYEELNERKYVTYKFPLIRRQKKYLAGYTIDITDLKRTERESLILKTAIDQAPVGIALADKDFIIYYCNPTGLTMRGGAPGDLIGIQKDKFQNWQVYTTDNQPYEIEDLPLVRAIKSGTIIREDFIIKHKDGSDHICDSIACPVIENNKIIGGMVLFLDITKRTLAEQALRVSEERFKLAMKFTNDGLYDWNLETNQIYYSPVWKSMLGYSDDELPNDFSTWEKLTRPEDIETSWKILDETLTGKRDRFELEFQMHHKNGNWVDILSRANVIFNDKGKGVRVVGTHVDITTRKQAEREIIRQKQKAERYLNLAGVMFIGLDRSGKINLVNKKACTILDFDQEKLIGRNWFDTCIPERRREKVRGFFDDLMNRSGGYSEYYENPIITKSGKECHIAWHNVVLAGDDGKPVGLLGSGEDITEKKKLQSQLSQAQKLESIGTLAGGIAHDFNNILSSIIGFTELSLDEAESGSTMQENLQEVYSAGKRATELVKQILAFARKSEEETILLKPRIIAKEIIHLLRSSIPSNIQITHQLDSDATIMGSPSQIHQVIMNLCTNAAHAMEDEGGQLTIVIKDAIKDQLPAKIKDKAHHVKYVQIQISDTGVGIPAYILDLVFEPYFTTKDPGEGTGLGLAMVHGIVENCGGHITVESQPGEGSIFTIYLPAVHQGAPQRADEPDTLPTGTERILIVDDEAPLVKMGRSMLESLGYQVSSRVSSTDALDLFKAQPADFDMVITDMTMPGLTGDKLAIEMMKIRADIPVILYTGYSKRISDESVEDLGIRALLYKPFVKAELARIVRKVLDENKEDHPL